MLLIMHAGTHYHQDKKKTQERKRQRKNESLFKSVKCYEIKKKGKQNILKHSFQKMNHTNS